LTRCSSRKFDDKLGALGIDPCMTDKRSIGDRFWEKVVKSPTCWEWSAYRDGQGYGHFRGVTGRVQAHRQAWELTHGAIPAGMLVCHMCDNTACVRPEHLYIGTHADNMRDMVARGRAWSPKSRYWPLDTTAYTDVGEALGLSSRYRM